MSLFTIGLILIVTAVVVFTIGDSLKIPKPIARLAASLAIIAGLGAIVISTAIYVEDNQGGIIVKKFGSDLKGGKIIATDGEKGPQAYVLPPGWHFWFWPWQFDLKAVDNIDIPQGKIGVVTAKDGSPLAKGEIFAPAWQDPQEMLDGMKFLQSGKGKKGPQLTVLPPGQYRFNPRLFNIRLAPVTKVSVGYVAVVKANAGEIYVPKKGEIVQEVNGVPMVPNDYRGIWKKALLPNTYYLHPEVYDIKQVQTTKRVYNYTSIGSISYKSNHPNSDNSIRVRSKDGYEFPVDVRVSVKISAENAPHVVAMLADPDADPDKDGFDVLEEKAVLPSLRSIFRNTAEIRGALEYVNSRSVIEKDATKSIRKDMATFKIDVDSVYVADIGLDKTPEGKELLKTQTDRQLALQQKATYEEQERAQLKRADVVRAAEAADQEKLKEVAKAKVDIAKNEAEAKKELAKGEAAAYAEKIKAFGGVEEYIRALMIEELVKVAPQIKLPSTLVIGGQGGQPNSAILTPLLTKMLEATQKGKK